MTLSNWEGNRLSKREVLQKACNKYGDFKVAICYPSGKWTKHVSVLEIWEKEEWWRLDNANNRQIFISELILDVDPEKGELAYKTEKQAKKIYFFLKKAKISFKCYFTGSRGYHFHINFNSLVLFSEKTRKTIRRYIVSRLKCDLMKINESTMIALEHAPHWKTGKIKKEVFFDESTNKFNKQYKGRNREK